MGWPIQTIFCSWMMLDVSHLAWFSAVLDIHGLILHPWKMCWHNGQLSQLYLEIVFFLVTDWLRTSIRFYQFSGHKIAVVAGECQAASPIGWSIASSLKLVLHVVKMTVTQQNWIQIIENSVFRRMHFVWSSNLFSQVQNDIISSMWDKTQFVQH